MASRREGATPTSRQSIGHQVPVRTDANPAGGETATASGALRLVPEQAHTSAGTEASSVEERERGELLAILCSLSDGLLLIDAAGGEQFTHMDRLLAGEPEREHLRAEILRRATSTWTKRRGATVLPPHDVPGAAEVATVSARYRARWLWLAPGYFGTPRSLLVVVDRVGADLPDVRALQERFRLTQRETEVALLLARRLSTPEIARTLGVSVHTARRHTENVMVKLGVSSRREVVTCLAALRVDTTGRTAK